MDRVLVSGALVLIGCLPVLAQDEPMAKGQNGGRRATLASVCSLAGTTGRALSDPARNDDGNTLDNVRHLARTTEPVDESAAPLRPDAQPKARRAERHAAPANNARKPAAGPARNRVQRQPQNVQAREQLGVIGFQPLMDDPFMGGWGNGIYSNRIIGYRSFHYSGYGNGYGYPCWYPGYGYGFGYGLGYGFGAVMPSISGPVTTRFADPVGRQHKMMDDAIRRFAEGK